VGDDGLKNVHLAESLHTSQVTFISIALYKIQFVSKQLYRDNRKIVSQLNRVRSTVKRL